MSAPRRGVRFFLVDREQSNVPDLPREHSCVDLLCGRAYTDHP